MAKPAVTLRTVKGSALSYTELDTNFTNLKDATVTLTAGSGGTAVTSDLNGTITVVAGTGITITGDNTAKTITITNASVGANAFGKIVVAGQSDVDADSTSDSLTLVAGSGITLTTNSGNDSVTITNSGNSLDTDSIIVGQTDTDDVIIQAQTSQDKAIILKAAYPGAPSLANYIKINAPGNTELRSAGVTVGNATGNSNINFTDTNWNVGSVVVKSSGQLVLQDSSSNLTNLTLTANEVSVKGPFKFQGYTTTERNALTAANGHVIYNTTDNKLQVYANGSWVNLH